MFKYRGSACRCHQSRERGHAPNPGKSTWLGGGTRGGLRVRGRPAEAVQRSWRAVHPGGGCRGVEGAAPWDPVPGPCLGSGEALRPVFGSLNPHQRASCSSCTSGFLVDSLLIYIISTICRVLAENLKTPQALKGRRITAFCHLKRATLNFNHPHVR